MHNINEHERQFRWGGTTQDQGGSTVNLARNDHTWGGRGADRPWGRSTVNHLNCRSSFITASSTRAVMRAGAVGVAGAVISYTRK